MKNNNNKIKNDVKATIRIKSHQLRVKKKKRKINNNNNNNNSTWHGKPLKELKKEK